ncbi:MAG: hypothetical protein JWO38_6089 [Gemmataceae bacterium]|nr:hypothetical protein [Gemmataceae bacterium]
MAQGLRGRLALLGAGVVLCTGLVGCMNDDKKTIGQLPTAKGSGPAVPGGMTTRTPGPSSGFTAGGPGAQAGNWNPNPGGVQPASGTTYSDPTYGNPSARNPGMINRPTVPNQTGFGGPMPGPSGSSYVPAVGPSTSSNFAPGGNAYPPQIIGYGSQNIPASGSAPFGSDPAAGTTTRAVAPAGASTANPYNPPAPDLRDVPLPPAAPAVPSYNPSVTPTDGPQAPLPPVAPAGAYPPMSPTYGK